MAVALGGCSASRSPARRLDPVFHKETPLLFAHRGGAREQPESTLLAFADAKTKGVDVLELDVQRTLDGQIVVWHGPQLDNVRIRGQNNHDPACRRRRNITQFTWAELEHAAWVADPCQSSSCCGGPCPNLELVPEVPARELLLLSQFLEHFPCESLNIELKSSIGLADVFGFLRLLDTAPKCRSGERRILIASFQKDLIEEVRSQCGGRYATNEPWMSALGKAGRCLLPLGPALRPMTNEALQTSWHWWLSCGSLIDDVRRAGGATHVFLTGLVFDGLDADLGSVIQDDIDTILDRGADGIMTDRPGEVLPLMKDWKRRHPPAASEEMHETGSGRP